MPIVPDGTNAALAAGQALELDQPPDHVRHRTGRSPRQQRLDKLWSWYTTDQYAARSVAWDGSKFVGQFERDTIAIAGYVPPGFYVANNQTIPIAFRRPTTPYHLARVIVDRFTSLLFSQRRHPKIAIEGDPDTDALLNAVIEEGRLWPTFMQARAFGGGTGTAVVGFKLVTGRPKFEVFDPRWCTPRWFDKSELLLAEIEYRYPFTQEMRIDGEWQEVELWYRRVVNTETDTVYHAEMIDEEEPREPNWRVAAQAQHNFGFCPIVWVQNMPQTTDVDGDPDCLGTYEMIEAMDRLIAQTEKSLLANLDPTLAIATNAQMGEVKVGSDNALKLQQGDTAQYLEINAAGIEAANKKIESYRAQILEVAQCVLEQGNSGTAKTATEIERTYAAMLAKADILREQYAEMGVKRLLNMVIVAIARLATPRAEGGQIVRRTITLPKRVIVDEETGTRTVTEHKLGPGPYRVAMHYPSYFEPSIPDTQQATSAAVAAKVGGLIDKKTAIRYVSNFFGVEDVEQMEQKIAAEQDQDQQQLEAAALGSTRQALAESAKQDEGGE